MCKLIAFIVDELKAALINTSYTVYQCHRQTLRFITHSAAVLVSFKGVICIKMSRTQKEAPKL